ncbi:putative protein OS=Tsukamurella paurometabola (strain ATCC 8368 / DSM / CCUG 35730 /CIP 100753 / JCM 10117 / KCTC 9821 / NBRC 16120 / NCIMB 702349/ NCTC 13040) OX=521096 GN=Tpau_0247 PE=4 SV=1 [Tsukamurella paurometabola]|uniref:Uncharacterized protein n=1 Tax=Tsukamurella paurometabola (strain ATCC 8368 / DSM 20162 / CCUG 35730 / CIP 100753 / JCM 10117 / KCTC 9821 / NBRC 16120 / NCIMB 702349 / NCTC 13040) TaxID=521096 RepID=D5UQR4_TSUPD|nr:hypothetical protein [Tsukamurella paurometabola]ADG76897.1 hypothetical protein Tpau_0247 [Tsukamurella paurometabola DSM 20162]SUP42126.1 Uncharacterised protein [Tsukamurella paurometabola]
MNQIRRRIAGVGAAAAIVLSGGFLAAPIASADHVSDCYALYDSTVDYCNGIAASGRDAAPCFYAARENLRQCLS